MHDEPTASSTGPSSTSTGPVTPGSHRKERGAIAAQACDTCRSRKQRCDEQRPKCGTCQKFKLNCNYREPQPTKKDRTLMEILDRIKNLEGKLDGLNMSVSSPPATYQAMPNIGTTTASMSVGIIDPVRASSFHFPIGPPSSVMVRDDHYVYASSAHQMMGWPVFQQLLETVKDKVRGLNPSTIETDGPAIVLGIHDEIQRMPLSADGSQGQVKTMGPLSIQTPGGVPVTIPGLMWETMQRLSRAYFDSFNLLFPIVDRHAFVSEILPVVGQNGFTENMASTVALLVFALGELAISGSQGIPIRVYNGRPSGIKGGTATEPPGLVLFNEARRRTGFNLTECSIENVQIFALAGLYYGACGHNTEQWRMTTFASLACQALISSKPSELSSSRGDVIRRAFWHCSMMETCLTLELGLPTTGLEKLEQTVGLPDFSGGFTQEDFLGNQSTHFQEHFASQIVIRRMMMDFHNTLSQALFTPTPPAVALSSSPFSSTSHSSTPSRATDQLTIKQLAQQLDQWRGMLPIPLRWQEESPGAFPANPGQEAYDASGFPTQQPLSPTTSIHPTPAPSPLTHHRSASGQPQHPAPPTPPLMFTTDLDAAPTPYPYAYDIQVALLRTRYYYTKYLLHRPFLHKALHHPDSMTADDAAGAAACLRAALKWPVTMSPTCTRKRLIPCLYFWTQNVLGVLLILHVASTDEMLQRIVRGGLCGETWEMDASETVGLYIDWLRDLKEADPAAGFGWQVVRAVYGLEE